MRPAVIEISTRMRLVLGDAPGAAEPDRIVLVFGLGGPDQAPTLRIARGPALPSLAVLSGPCITVVLEQDAWRELGGGDPGEDDARGWRLHPDLAAIASALRDGAMPDATLTAWRAAKGVELLCETIRLGEAARTAPLARSGTAGALSMADAARIAAARRMIDERWREPLSLAAIGRACGVNRAKLTRGFRDMFDCSIAQALAERRLSEARRMLATTDLPVSRVGYENGYLNNASFARAFARRFGAPPSAWRAASHGRSVRGVSDLAA